MNNNIFKAIHFTTDWLLLIHYFKTIYFINWYVVIIKWISHHTCWRRHSYFMTRRSHGHVLPCFDGSFFWWVPEVFWLSFRGQMFLQFILFFLFFWFVFSTEVCDTYIVYLQRTVVQIDEPRYRFWDTCIHV